MAEIYDIAILGAGPAGISAAIYAARARLNTLWLDRQFAREGQILNTYDVDNYPGLPGISGMVLGELWEIMQRSWELSRCVKMFFLWKMQKVQEVRRLSGQRSMNTEQDSDPCLRCQPQKAEYSR